MATATPIATELMVATDTSYTNLLKHYNGSYATQLPTATGELTKGVQLYSKMRHEDQNAGWTPWSTDVTFRIAEYQKWLIGTIAAGVARLFQVGEHLYLLNRSTGLNITKMTLDHTVVWYAMYNSGGGSNQPVALTELPDGNILVGAESNYFIKINSATGAVIWAKYIDLNPTTASSQFQSRTILAYGGYIYACGPCWDINSSLSYYAGFLVKLSLDMSSVIWMKIIKVEDKSNTFNDFRIGSDGYIYTIGTVLDTGASRYNYLAKWDTDGNCIWQKAAQFNSRSSSTYNSLSLDSNNNIYIAGSIPSQSGTSNTLAALPSIVKFTTDGVFVFAKILNSTTAYELSGEFSSIMVDSSDNVYVLGCLMRYSAVATGTTNTFVTRWSASGTCAWETALLTEYDSTVYLPYPHFGYTPVNTADNLYLGTRVVASSSTYYVGVLGIPLPNGPAAGVWSGNSAFSWGTLNDPVSSVTATTISNPVSISDLTTGVMIVAGSATVTSNTVPTFAVFNY